MLREVIYMPRGDEIDIRDFMNQKRKIPIITQGYEYVTVKEYAKIIKIHPVTVLRLLGSGKIEGALKVGRRWKIPIAKGN